MKKVLSGSGGFTPPPTLSGPTTKTELYPILSQTETTTEIYGLSRKVFMAPFQIETIIDACFINIGFAQMRIQYFI